jgi:putative restriction endonuclease
MTKTEIRERFQNLSTWQGRAPHKPLLALLALARCARGEERLIPYAQLDEPLKALLIEFGPPRKSHHPEYPFWYLQTDGVWTVKNAEDAKVRRGKRSQPTKRELLRVGAEGGFVPQVQRILASDRRFLVEVAQALLDGHFPDTLHQDILDAIGSI